MNRLHLFVAVAVGITLSTGIVFAQPVRDNRTPGSAGTGTITGRVVTGDREMRPLRRARVSLTSADIDVGRATVTADDGTFTFRHLPAGRYNVTAAKDGYVTMSFGAERPTRPGLGVEVRAGGQAEVTVRLPKGAVITGVVRLPTGEPAPGTLVMPLSERFNTANGERRLTTLPNTTVTADDRGEYRLYGLAPGTYIVSAVPRTVIAPGADIQVLSEGEVRRALAEVKAQSTAARPGMITPPPSPPRSADPPRAGVTLTPIYFPGTPSDKQATRLTIGAGEVRSGIDIDMEFVRTASIEGHVAAPAGTRVALSIANADGTSPNQSIRVSATPGEDGRFTFRSLPPGHYAISARAVGSSARVGSNPAETLAYGRTEVILAGEDISGITVALRPALTISGRIVFNGTTPAPALPSIRLPIPAATFGGSTAIMLPSVAIDGDRFSLAGALPGGYRFPSLPLGVRSPIGPWWLESLVVNRKELLDGELQLQESDDEAVITFTDRPSILRGTARYASGLPFREGLVVVFSADPRSWFFNSRRVAAIGTTANGQYEVKNLPPGNYLVTVAVGLERNEWFDPETLASLAGSAQTLTIGRGENKVHDLILAK